MNLPELRVAAAGGLHEGARRAPVVEPWSGATLAEVHIAGAAHAEAACAAARDAFGAMKRTPSHLRRRALRSIAEGLAARRETFAELIAREAGKPIQYARAEVQRAIVTFEWGAEEAGRIGGEVFAADATEPGEPFTGSWTRVPRGPLLAISPFNFPLNLVAHKLAPAFACGVPVVLKPAPQTPLTALALAELVRASGLPTDALQVLPCDVDVAELLVKDDRFTNLSFTGSAKVGWHLKSICGKKLVTLELGGNAAAIVHADAPSHAAASLTGSAFAYAGQVCIKTQRIFVHESVAEAFTRDFVARTSALAPADVLDAATVLGPLIDEGAAKRVDEWVHEAVAAGAKRLTGGDRTGNRVPATVLAIEGAGRGLKVVEEEVFGPVVTIQVYSALDDALTAVNGTRYGLQASVFTDSQKVISQTYRDLDVGGLVVNDTASVRFDHMPYGGVKDSGLGREGVRFAMEDLLEKKVLLVRR